jgi:Uma2 family endonuclease
MATPKFTLEDYLAEENAGPVRHDYLAGLRFPRPLPSPTHRHLSETLGARLRTHLRHDACYVFTGGIRIRVPDFDAVYYADAAVAVDPHYEEGTFVRAPILAVDIFGRAPGPNRKRRLAHYLSLGSLRQYVLLAPHQPSAMVYGRDADEDDAWYQEAIGAGDLLHLTSVSLAVPLASLYEGAPEIQQAEPGGLGLPSDSADED